MLPTQLYCRTPAGAIRAVQRVSLGGHGKAAWLQQLRQLNNVIHVLWKTIETPAGENPRTFRVRDDTVLFLQRQVFAKVRGSTNYALAADSA